MAPYRIKSTIFCLASLFLGAAIAHAVPKLEESAPRQTKIMPEVPITISPQGPEKLAKDINLGGLYVHNSYYTTEEDQLKNRVLLSYDFSQRGEGGEGRYFTRHAPEIRVWDGHNLTTSKIYWDQDKGRLKIKVGNNLVEVGSVAEKVIYLGSDWGAALLRTDDTYDLVFAMRFYETP